MLLLESLTGSPPSRCNPALSAPVRSFSAPFPLLFRSNCFYKGDKPLQTPVPAQGSPVTQPHPRRNPERHQQEGAEARRPTRASICFGYATWFDTLNPFRHKPVDSEAVFRRGSCNGPGCGHRDWRAAFLPRPADPNHLLPATRPSLTSTWQRQVSEEGIH